MPRELSDNQFSGQDFSRCLNAALRFISYRPRTIQEVKRRLAPGFEDGPIDKTIDYLLALGYLDDAAFTGQWISSRERRRPKGARYLTQELRRLGVEQGTIEEALEGYDEEKNAYNAAFRTAERLATQQCSYKDFRRKVGEYLARRGFAYSTINEIVIILWNELGAD